MGHGTTSNLVPSQSFVMCDGITYTPAEWDLRQRLDKIEEMLRIIYKQQLVEHGGHVS